MRKLISLKEKPATKEDVGKTIYFLSIDRHIQEITLKGNDYKLSDGILADQLFWQKPRIISEDEYQELRNCVVFATETVCQLCVRLNPQHKDCDYCNDMKDCLKIKKEVLNG